MRRLYLLVGIATVLACHRSSEPVATGPVATGESSSEAQALLAAVPADAFAVGVLDPKVAFWDVLTHGWPIPLAADEQAALQKELRETIAARVGLDVSGVRAIVGFGMGTPPKAAFLIKTVTGKLAGAHDDGGVEMAPVPGEPHVIVGHRGDVLAVGEETAVRAAFDVLAKKQPSFVGSKNELATFLVDDGRGALFAAAAHFPENMPVPPELAGLTGLKVAIGGNRFRVIMEGEPAALQRIRDVAAGELDKAIAESEAEKQAAIDQHADTAPLIGLIVTSHYVRGLKHLVPTLDGKRLVADVHFELGDNGAASIMVIGILAAVAIPAFMDYMKKPKRTESSEQLNRLAKNLKVLYMQNGKLPAGHVGLTPPKSCCPSKCVDPDAWSDPVWQQLDFALTEPHLFQYSYDSDGTTATVRAVTDLDCDGVSITYTLDASPANGHLATAITEPPPNSD
jgi:type II secretory pathway pseudopilin PulG